MDIYIAIDKKDKKKFITKADAIKQELEKENNQVEYTEDTSNLQVTKQSLCIAFTNNLEYIEKLYTNKKLDIICITSRLEGQYILDILEYVKDIYFLNIGLKEVVMRIQGYVKNYENRRKCIRGKLNNVQ